MKTLSQYKEIFQDSFNPNESILELYERRRAFLDYTALFYNSNNRGIRPAIAGKACTYYPTENSPGCAIGQHITDELKRYDSLHYLSPASGTYLALQNTFASVGIKLPEWLTSLGTDFLSDVQLLHDMSENWTEDGLTKEGWKEHSIILSDHTDDTVQ